MDKITYKASVRLLALGEKEKVRGRGYIKSISVLLNNIIDIN